MSIGPLPFVTPSRAAATPSKAQWTWDVTSIPAKILSYPSGTPTKTGLLPQDLQAFIGVPLIFNTINIINSVIVNTPIPLTAAQQLTLIRQAEDWVEQNSGVLLTTTWISSPPIGPDAYPSVGQVTTSPPSSGQIQGVDYDLVDTGYDFFYRRFLMEGWGAQSLRYRPLQQVYHVSFIYPLLSQFFIVPLSWTVQDRDFGYVRIVPAANVQMLPLFAMQLAFMGFAENLPGALWYQYTAGLSSVDYQSRFAFVKTLVLTQASIYALNMLQGSVNFGAIRSATSVDGLRYDVSYPNTGAAYSGLITSFTMQRNELLESVCGLISGPKFVNI